MIGANLALHAGMGGGMPRARSCDYLLQHCNTHSSYAAMPPYTCSGGSFTLTPHALS